MENNILIWPSIEKNNIKKIIKEILNIEDDVSLNNIKKKLIELTGKSYPNKDNNGLINDAYNITIKNLIINRNEKTFEELIQNCLEQWREEIDRKIKEVNEKVELYAHSLHYKSPGFGRWFRLVDPSGNGRKVFYQDYTLKEYFEEIYCQIPECLNISLHKDEPFNFMVILETKNKDGKIKIQSKIELPIKKLEITDSLLKKFSLRTLINIGIEIYSQRNSSYNDIKSNINKNRFLNMATNENKGTVLNELEGLFQINNNVNTLLNAISLLLSGYMVFRNIASIKSELHEKQKKLVIIIFPMKGTVSAMEKEGSWLIFLSVPNDVNIDTLKGKKEKLEEIQKLLISKWSAIRGADINAITDISYRYWSLDLERLLGEIALMKPEIIKQENKTRRWIVRNIGKKSSYEKPNWPDKIKNSLDHITGQNRQFIEFLHKLKETAELGKPYKEGNEVKAKVLSIFLYSEPGAGKETLAYLIHLWSRARFENKTSLEGNYIEDKKMLFNEFIKANRCLKGKKPYLKNPYSSKKNSEIIKEEIEDGFFTINCSILNSENFSKLLFGTVRKPSGILKAALCSGTCFFDEFNTIQKGLENHLLRLLVDPYEAWVYEGGSEDKDLRILIKKINCVFVFASNKKPKELIYQGYNPAAISRISQYYFELPPLKARKEDMILSLISQLLAYKKDAGWERVEPTALRFLCMLPWEGNYRTLKGFVDDLFNERKQRGITNRELTFKEVVECAVRRRLLGE